jgi:opacity protein-like surface antigen
MNCARQITESLSGTLFLSTLIVATMLCALPQGAIAQTGSDAQMEDALWKCLKQRIPTVERSIGDHARAFDPESKRNFAWDSDKQAWIDTKTLESICRATDAIKEDVLWKCLKQRIPTVERSIGDHTRAFDPVSKRNFAWDSDKQAWIDVKTLECICPKCPPPSTVKPPPQTSSVPKETSSGEEYAKALEFFGGGQYQRAPDEPVKNLYGFDASLFYNVNKHVSIGGDFSFLFGSTSETVGTSTFDTSLHRQTFLFGPQFNFYPDDKVKVFVHPLIGVVHDTVKFDFGTSTTDSSASAFAMAFGGGLDVRVTPRVSIRVFQADYMATHFGNEFQNNFRLSTGLVLRFGGKD